MVAGSSASPHATAAAPATFRDIVIVGGGCYGTFYAGQLEKARARGLASWRRILVVDRDAACQAAVAPDGPADREMVTSDWTAFFDQWLAGEAGTGDTIVPSPLMPHLMFEWVVRRASLRWPRRTVTVAPLEAPVGTPYDMSAPDGTRFVSYADWLCPVHCVEPAICPVTRAPRTWEMADAAVDTVRRLRRGTSVPDPVLFTCRHRVYGVGMFDADEVLAGDRAVGEVGLSGLPVDVVVGTVSACHGALSLLRLGPA